MPGTATSLTKPALHARACAALTVVSCVAHLWLAILGQHGPWLGLAMVALAVVCVPCTVHIWRHANVAALHRVTIAALAMVGVHTLLLLGAGGAGHAHGAGPTSSAAASTGSTQLLLIIGLEITTALLAATLVARLRRTRGGRGSVASIG